MPGWGARAVLERVKTSVPMAHLWPMITRTYATFAFPPPFYSFLRGLASSGLRFASTASSSMRILARLCVTTHRRERGRAELSHTGILVAWCLRRDSQEGDCGPLPKENCTADDYWALPDGPRACARSSSSANYGTSPRQSGRTRKSCTSLKRNLGTLSIPLPPKGSAR